LTYQDRSTFLAYHIKSRIEKSIRGLKWWKNCFTSKILSQITKNLSHSTKIFSGSILFKFEICKSKNTQNIQVFPRKTTVLPQKNEVFVANHLKKIIFVERLKFFEVKQFFHRFKPRIDFSIRLFI